MNSERLNKKKVNLISKIANMNEKQFDALINKNEIKRPKRSDAYLTRELDEIIQTIGPTKTAFLLGEWDTQNIKRWIRKESIPLSRVGMVVDLIKIKGFILGELR